MIGERLAFQSLSDFAHGVAGQWLVDTLIVTAALMALVLVLRRPVAKHFGAELAYALWAIPLARLFMPPLVQTIEVLVSAPAAPEVAETGAAIIPAAVAAATPAVDAMPEPSLVQSLLADADWFAIGVTVWLCGAAIFLIAQLSAYLQNRRELLEDAVEVTRIDDIRVIEIAGISGPFAFGLWQRYIALPIGFTRDYNPVERELALAHERSHHRAGDLWANFAALAMLSLHWFNPVAWMAWRAFRFDQEAACDARVLRRRTSAERLAYARAIAKAATGHTLAFASPLNPKEKIVERLKIMKQSETSKGRKWLGGSLIGGGLVTAMAMTATVSYAVQPVEPEAPDAPLAPDAPEAPTAPAAPSVEVDDGVYVYKLRREDGKQVVLRLNRPARQKELDRMAADAERSRADADRRIADADRAAADADRAPAQADRAIAIAIAERNRANAMARASQVIVRFGSPNDNVIELGDGRQLRLQTADCEGKPKAAAFMTQTETRNGQVTRTKVVTCGQMMPDEAEIAAQIERGMAEGRKSMERARAEIRRNPHLSAEDRAEALRDIDEGLREMRAGLAEARRELRRDMAEARREMSRIPAPPEAPEPPAPPARTW
ncbi:beta-lactamase regulating signal transducer with metallopeptidase domain [Blastomonas natatoria]|uniref:Beta-lactamase regulating signal transducer with metallopeptidase domain n=1 Tax=Blastomonas natatoria TaxID=34015 RepID=A0A2V3UZC4_9SPHN|nr:M56 family metallopeptidase [Blastomonas natatoria]PXW73345.1 beta-lactamase regulating signal transducer with metallopeptidase domain [Blastomonas natatoria]